MVQVSNQPRTTTRPQAPAASPGSSAAQVHTVKKGDTLWGILKKANPGASTSQMQGLIQKTAQMNNIKNPNLIFPGQKIQLPGAGQAGGAAASQAASRPAANQASSYNKANQNGFRQPQGGGQSAGAPSGPKAAQGRQAAQNAELNDFRQASGVGKGNGKDVKLNVPWYSQFQGGHGYTPSSTACFKAAVAMAKAGGATVLGPGERIQVGTGENRTGQLSVNSAKAKQGRDYIDKELAAGRPVVVGVSHKDSNYNVDGLTDHFVTITGKGTDSSGKAYYTFNEPGTTNRANSTSKFYVNGQGNLYRPGSKGSGYVHQRYYDVAMVRINAEGRR